MDLSLALIIAKRALGSTGYNFNRYSVANSVIRTIEMYYPDELANIEAVQSIAQELNRREYDDEC